MLSLVSACSAYLTERACFSLHSRLCGYSYNLSSSIVQEIFNFKVHCGFLLLFLLFSTMHVPDTLTGPGHIRQHVLWLTMISNKGRGQHRAAVCSLRQLVQRDSQNEARIPRASALKTYRKHQGRKPESMLYRLLSSIGFRGFRSRFF